MAQYQICIVNFKVFSLIVLNLSSLENVCKTQYWKLKLKSKVDKQWEKYIYPPPPSFTTSSLLPLIFKKWQCTPIKFLKLSMWPIRYLSLSFLTEINPRTFLGTNVSKIPQVAKWGWFGYPHVAKAISEGCMAWPSPWPNGGGRPPPTFCFSFKKKNCLTNFFCFLFYFFRGILGTFVPKNPRGSISIKEDRLK